MIIEDQTPVTETGPEAMSRLPRELWVVGGQSSWRHVFPWAIQAS